VFHLSANPNLQFSSFSYATAVLVGFFAMIGFVVAYLVTQVPLPLLVTGLYIGLILGASVLTLCGLGPTNISMWCRSIPRARALSLSLSLALALARALSLSLSLSLSRSHRLDCWPAVG
jgi:hypothetical protein